MYLKDIYIRDPFILAYNNTYYMYGKCYLDQNGFVVYKSKDLYNWSEPKQVFTPDEAFWADRDFWAPEVHIHNGKFYMIASFKSETRKRGTQILVSDTPDGSFKTITDFPITPKEWNCLDGTLYKDRKGRMHLVFCHEWDDVNIGTVCEFMLSDDLKKSLTKPRELWKASDFAGVRNALPGRKSLVTDGPFMWRIKNNDLICIWSSFGTGGYTELLARSSNGDIDGIWTVEQKPLMCENGGHGMIFKTFNGKTKFVYHSPNHAGYERAEIYEFCENGQNISLNKPAEKNVIYSV